MKKRLLAMLLAAVMAIALLPAAFAAARSSVSVTATKTDIRADGVFNTGGYGSLIVYGNWDEYEFWDEDLPGVTNPRIALVDRSGELIFPYLENADEYLLNKRYYYSDGIVSLVYSDYNGAYMFEGLPGYYRLDGTKAFPLEKTTRKETENGSEREITTSYVGGAMYDGYAVIAEMVSESGAGYAGGPSPSVYKIIDKNGAVTCELPGEFSSAYGGSVFNFWTQMSLGGRFGEGLLAFFEYSDGKGYMDHTGKTVIDLDGRGYQYLYPFSNGLALIGDENGKYGFIDKSGTLVIPCIYDAAGSFSSDGLAYVSRNGKYGYIDKTGSTVIPFEYDGAYGAGGGLAAVVKNGKCGLVDYGNNVAAALEYDDISSFEDGVAYAVKNGILYIITEAETPEEPAETVTPGESNPPAVNFTDVPAGEYYADAVAWAVEKGVTTGATATAFNPTGDCTRAQIVTFLWRAYGSQEPASAVNPFTDVKSGDYYYKAVLWAVEKGITTGATATTFNPAGPCTRAQAVTFQYRAAGEPNVIGGGSFTDVTAGAYYADAVVWAAARGIAKGTNDAGTTFSPNGVCSRAQIVTFLYRDLSD